MLKTQNTLNTLDFDDMHDGWSGIPSMRDTCPIIAHVDGELLDGVWLAVTARMLYLDSIEEALCLAAWFPEGVYLGD